MKRYSIRLSFYFCYQRESFVREALNLKTNLFLTEGSKLLNENEATREHKGMSRYVTIHSFVFLISLCALLL